MSRPPRARRPLLALLALALLASGCGADPGDGAAAARPGRHATHPGDGSQAPAPTPSQTASTPSATASAPATSRKHHDGRRLIAPYSIGIGARRSALEGHLLPAAQMPALDRSAEGDGGWVLGATGPDESTRLGACQQASLTSIGAVRAVRRTYEPAGESPGTRAVQVVAQFADRQSVRRAHAVLRSWREDCEAEVGPLRSVEVEAGTGERYRAHSPATEHRRKRTADLGIVVRGTYVSVVEISAPTRGFPVRRHPARPAVRRIARSFT